MLTEARAETVSPKVTDEVVVKIHGLVGNTAMLCKIIQYCILAYKIKEYCFAALTRVWFYALIIPINK